MCVKVFWEVTPSCQSCLGSISGLSRGVNTPVQQPFCLWLRPRLPPSESWSHSQRDENTPRRKHFHQKKKKKKMLYTIISFYSKFSHHVDRVSVFSVSSSSVLLRSFFHSSFLLLIFFFNVIQIPSTCSKVQGMAMCVCVCLVCVCV